MDSSKRGEKCLLPFPEIFPLCVCKYCAKYCGPPQHLQLA